MQERRAALSALIDASIRSMGAQRRSRRQLEASAEEAMLVERRLQEQWDWQQRGEWLQRKQGYQKRRR